MKLIRAVKDKREHFVLVDDEDFEYLNQFHWRLDDWGYAYRRFYLNRKRIKLSMHRELMSTPKGMLTDHIDGDILDNRKENLRICTSKQNAQNRRVRKDSATGIKGVFWSRQERKYKVAMRLGGKVKYFGTYSDLNEAIKLKKELEEEYHGEFRRKA